MGGSPPPRHPEALQLLAYWQDVMARGEGFVIGRDIPVRRLAPLLQNILIDEPLADGSDMRVRLAGTAVRRRFGAEVHGTLLSNLFPPADFRHHLAAGLEALRSGQPIVIDSSLKRGTREELHAEIVLLPILDRDGKAPLLLVGLFYFQ
jgi:hypothetical protein